MDILEELDTLRLGPSEYKIVQKAYTEIERLREALEKIADFDPNPSGSGPAYGQCGEMVRVARSALQQKESK